MISRTLFRQVSLTSVSSIFLSVVQLAVQVYVVRQTTQTDYGFFAFTFAIYSVLEALTTGFSSDLSMHFLGENSVREPVEIQGSRIVTLLMYDALFYLPVCALCMAGGYALTALPGFDLFTWTALCLSLMFQIGYSAVKNLLIVYNLIEIQTKYELQCIFLILILSLAGTGLGGIKGYALSIAAYQFSKTWLGILKVRQLGVSIPFCKRNLVSILSNRPFPTRIILSSISRNGLSNLYSQLDILLLGFLSNNLTYLANYKVAKTLSGVPTKIVYPVWAALRGRMVQAHYKKDFVRLRMLVVRPVLVFTGVFILLFGIAFLLSPHIVPLLYGHQYISSVPVFLVLLAGVLALQLSNNWFSFWVVMARRSSAYSLILLIQTGILLSGIVWSGTSGIEVILPYFVAASYITGGILHFIYFFRFTHNANTHSD